MSVNPEDLHELFEPIPQTMRDQFTNLRELDLSVENNVDTAKKLESKFFAMARKMNETEREAAHEEIMGHYNKAKEDAAEKVDIATRAQIMINNVIKRLDTHIETTKRDLNREIPGSAEKIEQLVLEADGQLTSNSGKENRYNLNSNTSYDKHSHTKKSKSKSKHLTRKEKKRRNSNTSSTSVEKRMVVPTSSSTVQEPRPASANSGPLVVQQQTSSLPVSAPASSSAGPVNTVVPVNSNVGHIRPGGNAIAAAASQAIAATQQMQQGRRTASLKASYEAVNTGGGVHAAEFSRELAGAAQTAIAAIQESSKKIKKKVLSANATSTNVIPASVQQQRVQQQSHQQQIHQQQTAAAATATAVTSVPSHQTGASVNHANVAATSTTVQINAVANVEHHEWIYDPNEPKYCICNQISYGEMVACDNLECPVEWFHYPCVNITAPPKGKWYCPQCTAAMKRRGGRKN